ncbi:uncharacterized protein PADG_11152 [Paracoccidioides brasiliensis Pb18]|uniref:Uncharacterized protein n=1 Tax=Paracoccidioides brasiliensis (strain Pb18) TaxID=502780 RepID=A0A0A0HZC7_PARBD|nr:uncharacterized protein PADG_11152 [Paracoccidioides brasiliensis Pb18]KGM92695.1 hypothetical protein PADG_11152 [Paracoccidioides brasiliensis Pb18]
MRAGRSPLTRCGCACCVLRAACKVWSAECGVKKQKGEENRGTAGFQCCGIHNIVSLARKALQQVVESERQIRLEGRALRSREDVIFRSRVRGWEAPPMEVVIRERRARCEWG